MEERLVDSLHQRILAMQCQAAIMQEQRHVSAEYATPPDGIHCDRCGNTGYISRIEEDGTETAVICPDCYAKRQVVRRLKQSGVNPDDYKRYTLASFKTDTPEARQMKSLALKFLDDLDSNAGFGLFGKSGTGKTHLCIAVCQELTRNHGEPHFYFSYRSEMPGLIQALRTYKDNVYEDALKKWKECKNLYIDDLFKLSGTMEGNKLVKVNKDDLQVMFDIFNARYLNHLRTIISSEYSINDIIGVDEALGSRIYDMIKPYGLVIDGTNRRLQKVV